MKNNKYIGHNSQLLGVEECRLIGGKGDGMRLLHVKNGCGLECTVSVDQKDEMFAKLAELVEAHNGLWNGEAEKYLLANAKPLA